MGYRPGRLEMERRRVAADLKLHGAGGGCWERPEKKRKRRANEKEQREAEAGKSAAHLKVNKRDRSRSGAWEERGRQSK